METIYGFKSKLFFDVFEDCQDDFKYEIFYNFEFRYYPAMHPKCETSNIYNRDVVDLPMIEKAGEYTKFMYFIINSNVHVMDKAGMYDYGVIGKGSYFGDISILLQQPNAFSYMYENDEEETDMLMLYRLPAATLRKLFEKFPLERQNWMARAKRRLEFFENFKAETLLKFMKGIIKNPRIIR